MNKQQKQQALEKIFQEIKRCKICKKNKIGLPVPGEGSADADVVFIGEAPGKQEAKTGRPFVGRAGSILRASINDIGLKFEDIFITSPVKYLPVHITPTAEEIAHGRLHLFKQLEIIEPKIVVLLGRVAAMGVLEIEIIVSKQHGKTLIKNGRTYFFTYHPAALLYSPKVKAILQKDFKKLKKILKN